MTRKNEQERFMSYITERQTHESRMAVADFFCGNMLTGIITLILFLLIRYSSRIAIISKRILKSVLF